MTGQYRARTYYVLLRSIIHTARRASSSRVISLQSANSPWCAHRRARWARWRLRWQRCAKNVPRMWSAEEGPQVPSREARLTWGWCGKHGARARWPIHLPSLLAIYLSRCVLYLCVRSVLCSLRSQPLTQPPRRDPLHGEPHIARRAYDVGSRSVSHRFIDS